jgi:hypothetical protein
MHTYRIYQNNVLVGLAKGKSKAVKNVISYIDGLNVENQPCWQTIRGKGIIARVVKDGIIQEFIIQR